MKTAEIVFNRTGQEIEFYAPECVRECLGIPSSVTASVFWSGDSNDDDVEFSPTVTVDAVSTTVDVASGQGQTTRNKVYLAATTSITAGRLYLLDNASSQREVVEPKKINSADSCELVDDLQYDYAITVSTFKGIRCTFPVDSTWVATETNILHPTEPDYRIRWQYTVGGVVYNHQTYMRLVRKPFKSTITFRDLTARWPTLLSSEAKGQTGEKYKRLIGEAESQVRSDILSSGYRPEQFADSETVDRLVNLALDYSIARFHAQPPGRERSEFISECKREYGDLFTKMITSLKITVDVGTEGASTNTPVQSYFFGR